MARVRLPANGWHPRAYQLRAWSYLENGGRHAELIWPRRHGKDEICLHWTAIAAMHRPAVYWHMLPQKEQARKAIWTSVNPHTGRRRVDEAFPHEIRKRTLEHEMMIEFVNGTAGFASYRPAGAGRWIFITTPRGKNHAHNTFLAAQKNPDAFAERLTALESGVFTAQELERERAAYIDEFGQDMGAAMFEQEYMTSFDAAILGAIYGAELRDAESAGRICDVPHDPALPVHAVMDMGWSDDTAILFFQVRGEVREAEGGG